MKREEIDALFARAEVHFNLSELLPRAGTGSRTENVGLLVATLRALTDWCSMETAPRDGTDIQILAKGGEQFTAFWDAPEEKWCFATGRRIDRMFRFYVKDPVAWHQLVPPPKGDA